MELINEEYITAGTNQARLLAAIWRNEKLYFAAKGYGVRPSDFSMLSCEIVCKVLLEYRAKYGKMPSTATLQDLVATALKDSGDNGENTIHEMCGVLKIMSDETVLDYDYANDVLIKFVRQSRVDKSLELFHGDTEKLQLAFDEIKVMESMATKPQVSPFKSFHDMMPKSAADKDIKIPTGIQFVDIATNGGLNASINEIGLGIAGTGVGKTTMMVNFAVSAAQNGYNVLFITLELKEVEISRRIISVAAHIRTSEMRKPLDEWSEDSLKRIEFLEHSNFEGRIKIADKSDRNYSVSDLVGEIEKWKRETKEATGSDEKCRLVIIDWLDMLVPEARDMRLVQQQWQALERIGKDLKHMVNNQNVALWCVSQANRAGSGAQKVRLDHVSGSFSKNFFGAVVLGLAPVEEDDDAKTVSQNMSNEDMKKLKKDPDRELHLSIIKNRDGAQLESDIYHGPTMKFWKSRSAWRTQEKLLATNDMQKIFGDGIK